MTNSILKYCFLLITWFLINTNMIKAEKYKIHDLDRPKPNIINVSNFSQNALPPSDAIILFNGNGLDEWKSIDEPGEYEFRFLADKGGSFKLKNKNVKWKSTPDYFEAKKGTGSIITKKSFGDVQLHIEWSTPTKIEGESQGRGNSGVFFMAGAGGWGYEIQVLDSYNNPTYADGQAGAIYGQFPPLFNAAMKPGEWQTYDIIFSRPRFDSDKNLIKPAYVTVIHNGVLIQNHKEIVGPTSHKIRAPYVFHEDRLPIQLQDHSNPVRFRNIWVRDLEK